MLNRLLEREEWARLRLAPFAGASVEARGPVLPPWRFTILPGGLVEAGGGAPELLADLSLRGVAFSGNEKLAAEADVLLRHLRWDAEEDLSRLFGDAAAHRVAGTASALLAWQRDAAERLAQTFAAYAADELHLLVRPHELEQHAGRVAALAAALERLAARIGRLE